MTFCALISIYIYILHLHLHKQKVLRTTRLAPLSMKIAAAAVTQCQQHVEVHQQVTVAQVRAGNSSPVGLPRAFLEHEANASHVEIESRVHICVTKRPQHLALTAVFNRRAGRQAALYRRIQVNGRQCNTKELDQGSTLVGHRTARQQGSRLIVVPSCQRPPRHDANHVMSAVPLISYDTSR